MNTYRIVFFYFWFCLTAFFTMQTSAQEGNLDSAVGNKHEYAVSTDSLHYRDMNIQSLPNDSSNIDSTKIAKVDKRDKAQKQPIYLQGDIDILSQNAPRIVEDLSQLLYQKTGIQVFMYVVKTTPHNRIQNEPITQVMRFQDRRDYEASVLAGMQGKYAVIFLFYEDHAITIKSNLDLLDEARIAELLENYAYPYLPADSVGTTRYDDGVNEGVSNLYLALIHTIAAHNNMELDVPKPLERQSDATKVVIYAMLLIMIGLFILVRFGFLAFKRKG